MKSCNDFMMEAVIAYNSKAGSDLTVHLMHRSQPQNLKQRGLLDRLLNELKHGLGPPLAPPDDQENGEDREGCPGNTSSP